MSIKEIGSVFITGQFKDMGMIAAIKMAKNELKGMGGASQSVTNDMIRMTGRTKLLTAALGLIGIGGFASLVSMMPRVSAQLALAKVYVSLIALELDDNFAPVVEYVNGLLETFVGWFQGLPEPLQTVMGLLGLLGGGALVGLIIKFASLALGAGGLSAAVGWLSAGLATLWGWIVAGVTYVAGLAAGSTALAIAILAVVAAILLLIADALGFFDWIDGLTTRCREARDEGSLWAAALLAILSPIQLLGNAIDLLLGRKSWQEFKSDVVTLIDDFIKLKDAILDFISSIIGIEMPSWMYSGPGWLTGNSTHDVGTANVTYTGWHWLQAGESVNMRGIDNFNQQGNSGGNTTITNKFGDVILNNGMDLEEFVSFINKRLASNAAWRR